MREAEEERVAVIQTGSDETVDKVGGSVGGNGGRGGLMFRRWK